jgi:hypothetical protein
MSLSARAIMGASLVVTDYYEKIIVKLIYRVDFYFSYVVI